MQDLHTLHSVNFINTIYVLETEWMQSKLGEYLLLTIKVFESIVSGFKTLLANHSSTLAFRK